MARSRVGERIEEEETLVDEDDISSEKTKRIFINHVDLYHGKHIARVSRFN